MNTKRFSFTLVADGETAETARLTLNSFARATVEDLGFVHPDGEVLPCPPPPTGYSLFRVYYGEGDSYLVAVPKTAGDVSQGEEEDPKIFLPSHSLEWTGAEWKDLGLSYNDPFWLEGYPNPRTD